MHNIYISGVNLWSIGNELKQMYDKIVWMTISFCLHQVYTNFAMSIILTCCNTDCLHFNLSHPLISHTCYIVLYCIITGGRLYGLISITIHYFTIRIQYYKYFYCSIKNSECIYCGLPRFFWLEPQTFYYVVTAQLNSTWNSVLFLLCSWSSSNWRHHQPAHNVYV